MFQILALLFILIPALEIFIFIESSQIIGASNTFLIVILTGVTGAYFAKSQGLKVFNELQMELSTGRSPQNSLISGVFILVGGILLLTPGFLTDVFGISLLLPPTRILYLAILKEKFLNLVKNGNIKVYTSNPGGRASSESPDVFEADFKKKD